MSEEDVDIVRQAFTAAPGPPTDPEVLERFFDPAVEWIGATDSLVAGTFYGHDGVRRFWEELLSAWDDYRVEALDFRDVGDNRVVVVTRMHGRTRDIEVDQLWSVLVTLREGKVVRIQGFSKPEGASEAAGLS